MPKKKATAAKEAEQKQAKACVKDVLKNCMTLGDMLKEPETKDMALATFAKLTSGKSKPGKTSKKSDKAPCKSTKPATVTQLCSLDELCKELAEEADKQSYESSCMPLDAEELRKAGCSVELLQPTGNFFLVAPEKDKKALRISEEFYAAVDASVPLRISMLPVSVREGGITASAYIVSNTDDKDPEAWYGVDAISFNTVAALGRIGYSACPEGAYWLLKQPRRTTAKKALEKLTVL